MSEIIIKDLTHRLTEKGHRYTAFVYVDGKQFAYGRISPDPLSEEWIRKDIERKHTKEL